MSDKGQEQVPGIRQYARLRGWAKVGAWVVAGRKSDYESLIRNGWVEQDPEAESDNPYTWLRITPDGYRAIAAAIEKHGRPSLEVYAMRTRNRQEEQTNEQ